MMPADEDAVSKDLRPPEHQVAGHRGPLIDGSGLFYKPLQDDDRGAQELSFYTAFSAHPAVPDRIRTTFFPRFHGTHLLPSSSDHHLLRSHLVLEDLLAGMVGPTVIDLKMGSRTWPPNSPEEYITNCFRKDRETTSVALGFRVSGVQIRKDPGPESGLWKPERREMKKLDPGGVRRLLRRFVSRNVDEEIPDCELAKAVYGGEHGVLAKLVELKEWFEEQTVFHFYSASLLIAYEAEKAVAASGDSGGGGDCAGVRVKLVDFAHFDNGDGVIDHNFLGGLCSLIKFVSDIVAEEEGSGGGVREESWRNGAE